MDLKDIKELIKTLEKSSLNELNLKNGDFELSLIKNSEKEIISLSSAPVQQMPYSQSAPIQTQVPEQITKTNVDASSNNSNLIEIKSPMVGTFYKASSPDSPAFVNNGDMVNEDKVVCIIEAMKLFNEIKAEVKGKVAKILVNDGDAVEYGQPLFLIEP